MKSWKEIKHYSVCIWIEYLCRLHFSVTVVMMGLNVGLAWQNLSLIFVIGKAFNPNPGGIAFGFYL